MLRTIAWTFILAGCSLALAAVGQEDLVAWQADSMTKVFQQPAAGATDHKAIPLHAARNEVISAQFVFKAAADVTDLKCEAEWLNDPGGARIPTPRVRYVGYVSVKKNSDDSAIHPAPAEFPDPLLESAPVVKAGNQQPIWVTITIPKNVSPGEYVGRLNITAAGSTTKLPIQLTVHSCVLTDERNLKIANWFLPQPAWEKLVGAPYAFDNEKCWEFISVVARNMAQHRQNVILTMTGDLVTVGVADNKLTFDFSRFDRWMKLFVDAGVLAPASHGMIEGGHLAGGKYGAVDHQSSIWSIKDGKAVKENVSSWSNQNHQFLKAYLPALQAHLEKMGWLSMYRQHIFDEPVDANRSHYLELSKTLRESAPKLKTIEATHSSDLVGSIDVWVPETDHLAGKLDFYKGRQKAGDELWYYTCLNPHAPHLNRFMDYPLLKPRLLHWANFSYGVTGYLHWGWNCWPAEPFKEVEFAGQPLPSGDSHLVYPKLGGVLDSIRSEAMLEGIQDFELLSALSAKNPEKAKAICQQVLQDWTHYTLDIEVFRTARKQLLDALSQ